ncbi:MAG: glycosyltransferase family 4 protein [Clostridiales bacterium]|nr:glycosyltransferase family 4 protein [Clostridiales bacterium]
MRIGLTSDTFLPVVDGVGRVVVAYANTLAKLGHEVTVSAPMYDTGHRGGYAFELVDFTGYKVPTAPQYKTGTAIMDTHYKKRMEMIELDIVHSHSPFAAGREALRLAKQRCIPLITTFHSKYYDDFMKATHSETLTKAILANIISFYDKCDEVWALSQSSAQVLRGYGFRGEIQVMPNGTQQRSVTDADVAEAARAFGLNEEPVLLFVGQINWKKNILRILEAAAKLAKEQPRFKLVLAGQGPDEKDIRKKAQELGLHNQLVLTGMITSTTTLDALYKRADLFVFPSLYDTFSLVIREAAAMGTPSVAISGSCAGESIIHGENGFLCEDQTDSLYQAIKLALDHPEMTRQIGVNAHKSIPVSWEEIIQKVEARYQGLIDRYVCDPHPAHRRYQRKKTKIT